eukprot:TRINITY_DN13342_c0_g2_i1.p1 TRINITY_DN13342_c0_g2~~TRINITY_DN13342_c0_g2_i1.p1  ORF type:complete len:425 (-),score=79.63 TRINITY_DN13342_c0_g2_i1:66-1340(-)
MPSKVDCDAPLTPDYAHDPYTTHIGGIPSTFDGIQVDVPKCPLCQGKMSLILQAYSPLPKVLPTHERLIHVYACPREQCSCASQGWKVIRVQYEYTPPEADIEPNLPPTLPTSNIIAKQDDWGVASDWGSPSGDWGTSSSSSSSWSTPSSETLSTTSTSTSTSNVDTITNDIDALLRLRDKQKSATAKTKGKKTSSSKKNKLPPTLPSPTQPNEPIDQPLSSSPVDTPAASDADLTSDPTAPSSIIFTPYFIDVDNEPDDPGAEYDDNKEEEEEDVEASDESGDEGASWQAEEYEYVEDRTFHRFCKRINWSPEQCLRYCFGGQPLLASDVEGTPKEILRIGEGKAKERAMAALLLARVPPCQHCGAKRVYEMQLLSTLLSSLQVKDGPPHQMDFATVLVYACSASCIVSEAVEEYVVIQHTPQ